MATFTKPNWSTLVLTVLAIAAVGCGELQPPGDNTGNTSGNGDNTGTGDTVGTGTDAEQKVAFSKPDNTHTEAVVDASADDVWVYVDLDNDKEVKETDAGWDVAFKRFHIHTNTAVNVATKVVDGVLDDVTAAPAGEYQLDSEDGADEDSVPEYVISTGEYTWYDYDQSTHVLTPRKLVYVIRTSEMNYMAFVVDNYYDAAGSSGVPTVRWKKVTSPPAAQTLTVDASNNTKWVYVDLDTATVLTEVPADGDTTWDVGLLSSLTRTNSGTSGTGTGGAVELGTDFETVKEFGTKEAVVDTEQTSNEPGTPNPYSGNAELGGWYDYDSEARMLSASDRVYGVLTGAGERMKLQVVSWTNGVYELKFAPIN